MPALLTNGLRLPRWAGFVLAAVVLPFAAVDARATCGDHVQLAGHQPAKPQAAEEKKPLPCDGPNCSRSPERVPLLPVAQMSIPVAKDACSVVTPSLPVPESAFPVLDSPLAYPSGDPFRLERPPRG